MQSIKLLLCLEFMKIDKFLSVYVPHFNRFAGRKFNKAERGVYLQ